MFGRSSRSEVLVTQNAASRMVLRHILFSVHIRFLTGLLVPKANGDSAVVGKALITYIVQLSGSMPIFTQVTTAAFHHIKVFAINHNLRE